jgi:Kef-type K+ transport system membrane component KefB
LTGKATMTDTAKILLTLGALLFLGFVTDSLGRRTKLPRVTLLLLFGILVGPSGLDLLPDFGRAWFPVVSNMALVMVGFLLGGKLSLDLMRTHGRGILSISAAAVLATTCLVFLGLLLMKVRADVALLLAGIAPATAPAATADVVRESNADGPFTRTLLGVVAVDDAWGLLVFSIALAGAQALSGGGGVSEVTLVGAWEIFGALLVGILLGIPMAYLTGRIEPGEPTLAEALGIVFVCGGLALALDVSFLLASMVTGVVVVNLAKHHERPFHAIEGIEWPFLILLFVLAGASLQVASVHAIGPLVLAYVILRAGGRILGGWLGSKGSDLGRIGRKWMGLALMPQAGVALGMALVASNRFPSLGPQIMSVVICATVVFEIVGPVLTKAALSAVGESDATGLVEK